MARVTLILPDNNVYETVIPVMVSDLNYGGHVGNDRILTIMHEARLRYIRSIGFTDEMSIEDDIGMLVADSVVVYKSESFYGDEIKVRLGIDDLSAYGMDIYYKLEHQQTGKEIARGKTGIVFFDLTRRKVAKIPPAFLRKIPTQA